MIYICDRTWEKGPKLAAKENFCVIEVTRPFSTFLDNFSAIGSRVSEIYWIYRSLCEGYDSKKTGPDFNTEVGDEGGSIDPTKFIAWSDNSRISIQHVTAVAAVKQVNLFFYPASIRSWTARVQTECLNI